MLIASSAFFATKPQRPSSTLGVWSAHSVTNALNIYGCASAVVESFVFHSFNEAIIACSLLAVINTVCGTMFKRY